MNLLTSMGIGINFLQNVQDQLESIGLFLKQFCNLVAGKF